MDKNSRFTSRLAGRLLLFLSSAVLAFLFAEGIVRIFLLGHSSRVE